MSGMIDEIMSQLSGGGIQQISSQLGVDEAQGTELVAAALPALLGGLSGNASSPEGAAALFGTLDRHNDSLFEMTNPLEAVDVEDGRKIVGHVLGDRQDAVINNLAGAGSAKGSMLKQLLPILAPIVLSWLANRKRTGGLDAGGLGGMLGAERDNAANTMPDLGGLFEMLSGGAAGGGLGDVIGDVLGGATGGGQSSGGGLGDVIGDVLGGATGGGQDSGGGLGDMVGDVLEGASGAKKGGTKSAGGLLGALKKMLGS